jgi:uncharacterized membrane protein YfcA
MDPVSFIIIMLLVGASVGFVSAALGIGGGMIMVPVFTILWGDKGMDVKTAMGSSLLAIIFVAGYNAWRMNRGTMRNPVSLARNAAIGSVFGGFAGGSVVDFLPAQYVTWFFVALLCFAGFRAFILKDRHVEEKDVEVHLGRTVVIGLATGFVAGMTGTGGGAIFVPFALMAGIVSNYRVVALSNMVMVVTAIAAVARLLIAEPTYDSPWTVGLVDVSLAPLVVAGALVGSPYGRKANAWLTFQRRRIVMGGLLIFFAIRLLLAAN